VGSTGVDVTRKSRGPLAAATCDLVRPDAFSGADLFRVMSSAAKSDQHFICSHRDDSAHRFLQKGVCDEGHFSRSAHAIGSRRDNRSCRRPGIQGPLLSALSPLGCFLTHDRAGGFGVAEGYHPLQFGGLPGRNCAQRRSRSCRGIAREPLPDRPELLLGECKVLGPGHVERRLLLFLRQPGDLFRDEIAEGEHANRTV
jgi:hypothetical protein